MTKKVTQARKGLGTNSVGLATELSLVSKLLQKVIPKKISAIAKLEEQCNPLLSFGAASITFVTLHGISGNKVNARTRQARTLKQKNQVLTSLLRASYSPH